jgi:hypothetical protein
VALLIRATLITKDKIMKDAPYDYSGLLGVGIGVVIGLIFTIILFAWDPLGADKNVPKNNSMVTIDNEWTCQPSPKLQQIADDNMLDMEVMVCSRDKPKE